MQVLGKKPSSSFNYYHRMSYPLPLPPPGAVYLTQKLRHKRVGPIQNFK